MAERTARERCGVTAPSPARNLKVSLNSSSFFFAFSLECLLIQRAHTERLRAPLDRLFSRRQELLRSVQSRAKLSLVLREAVPSEAPRLDQRQSQHHLALVPGRSQSFQRLPKNDTPVLFSHDLSGPNLSCCREARLLQSANMTPKFEDGKVLSRKGCHVHGAEFPTECACDGSQRVSSLAVSRWSVGRMRAPCSVARVSGGNRGKSLLSSLICSSATFGHTEIPFLVV